MYRSYTGLILVASALAFALAAGAAEIAGKVVNVHDGDTLTVLVDRHQVRVRLVDIDAPELDQPFGIEARGILRAFCPVDALAQVSWKRRDVDKRVLGSVTCGGVDVNAQLVRRGGAWVFSKYAARTSPLYALEEQARKEGIGLWFSANRVPPWEWRRRKRAGTTT